MGKDKESGKKKRKSEAGDDAADNQVEADHAKSTDGKSSHSSEDGTQSKTTVAAAATAAAIKQHNIFFSRIISMIPRDLYKPTEEEEEEAESMNTKYFKHKKQPLPVDVKKQISKRKIAEKYGVDQDQSRDQGQEEGEEEDGQLPGEGDEEEDAAAAGDANNSSSSSNQQMQTLRERLQARITDMKSSRQSQKRPFEPSSGLESQGQGSRNKVIKTHASADAASGASKTTGAGANVHSGNKVKGAGVSQTKNASSSSSSSSSSGSSRDKSQANVRAAAASERDDDDDEQAQQGRGGSSRASRHDNDDNSASLEGDLAGDADIDFSAFSGSAAGGAFNKLVSVNKGKPGTKKQRLERMLEAAEGRRERLDQLRKSGSEGQARVEEEQWNELLNTAQGKDSIDISKVKKALKRREKDKQKSAKEWNERIKAVEDGEKSKIEKRETNLKQRKQQTNGIVTEEDVKAASKGERVPGGRNKEKALENRSQRPGFEGKAVGGAGGKQGQFLNSKEKKKLNNQKA